MERLQAELDEAFPSIDDSISHADVRNLPYLNAVINETLRVHPIGAGDAQCVAPAEGMIICGHYIPGGTIVIIPQHRLIVRPAGSLLYPIANLPEFLKDMLRVSSVLHGTSYSY
jgi:tryprostatin B 6-hydroxylase